MYLNLGAQPSTPVLQVGSERQTSRRSPNTALAMRTAAKNLNDPQFQRLYGPVLDTMIGEKPSGRPLGQPVQMDLKVWSWVRGKLDRLYPRFQYREDAEGRLVILKPVISNQFAAEYEIFPADIRREADDLKDTPGPQTALIGVSTGCIPYKTDVLTDKKPPRLVCRSLVSVIRACVRAGAFTVEEAERAFALKFKGVAVGKVYMDIEPLAWSKRSDGLITTGAA